MYCFNNEKIILLLKWDKEGYSGQKGNQVESEGNRILSRRSNLCRITPVPFINGR